MHAIMMFGTKPLIIMDGIVDAAFELKRERNRMMRVSNFRIRISHMAAAVRV